MSVKIRDMMNKDEEKVICNRIVSPEDYDMAAEALIELKYTSRELAETLVLQVLQNPDEEPYYQATAFNIFYSLNPTAGLDMISARPDEVNLIMLRSMIGCVTEDSALIEGNDNLLAAVKAVDKKINELDSHEVEGIKDNVTWFKETYKEVL